MAFYWPVLWLYQPVVNICIYRAVPSDPPPPFRNEKSPVRRCLCGCRVKDTIHAVYHAWRSHVTTCYCSFDSGCWADLLSLCVIICWLQGLPVYMTATSLRRSVIIDVGRPQGWWFWWLSGMLAFIWGLFSLPVYTMIQIWRRTLLQYLISSLFTCLCFVAQDDNCMFTDYLMYVVHRV